MYLKITKKECARDLLTWAVVSIRSTNLPMSNAANQTIPGATIKARRSPARRARCEHAERQRARVPRRRRQLHRGHAEEVPSAGKEQTLCSGDDVLPG